MSTEPQSEFTLTGADLAEFDDEYAGATPTTSGDSVPDGKYQVRVARAYLAKSRKKQTPMLKWELTVLSGPQAGRRIFAGSFFSPAAMPYTKGTLKLCGVEPAKLSELPQHLPALLDKTLEVAVVTDGDQTNVYFNKSLEIPAGQDRPPPAGDDLPF